MIKKNPVFLLGILCLTYWIFDFINIIFMVRNPSYLLWLSPTGLLLTSIALLKRNSTLISSMFCALFVMELVWMMDFFSHILFNNNFLGLTNYLFDPVYTRRDFIMSMYHLVIPPSLLYAIIKTKKVYRYAWLGSVVYVSTVAILTYFLVDSSQEVNCVHLLTRCKGLFLFVFKLAPKPYHILASLFIATVFIFIPTNYILLKIAKKLKWEIYPKNNE